MYKESMENPEKFWLKQAENFHWQTQPDPNKVLAYNFDRSQGEIFIRWFDGGKTNLCYNCVDRHVEKGNGKKIAFYWLVLFSPFLIFLSHDTGFGVSLHLAIFFRLYLIILAIAKTGFAFFFHPRVVLRSIACNWR